MGFNTGTAPKLSFPCLVLFAEAAHSIILTSGTLAPLDSFASEASTYSKSCTLGIDSSLAQPPSNC